jgi:hypothetical protein
MKQILKIVLVAAFAANLQGQAAAFDLKSFAALAEQAERTSTLVISINGGTRKPVPEKAAFISYCGFITGQDEPSCEVGQGE